MKQAFTFILLAAGIAAAADTRIKLPNSRADLARGEKLFLANCGRCHGDKGDGGIGPSLAQPKLRRAPDDGALVQIILDGIRGTEMPGAAGVMTDREAQQTAAFVRTLGRVPSKAVPGNAANGGEIVRGKGGCVACHAMGGTGGISAPDLSGVGGRRSAAHLLESLTNPGASVPDGYLLVSLTPKSGPSVTGVRVSEDSFSIQIRNDAGRYFSFWKEELAQLEKQRGKSPMPSYKDKLSAGELTDVVAYLASLKEAK
jgi:putative heme-binding domain-containing protein